MLKINFLKKFDFKEKLNFGVAHKKQLNPYKIRVK